MRKNLFYRAIFEMKRFEIFVKMNEKIFFSYQNIQHYARFSYK